MIGPPCPALRTRPGTGRWATRWPSRVWTTWCVGWPWFWGRG